MGTKLKQEEQVSVVAAGEGVGLNLKWLRTCLNPRLMCLCSCRLFHKHTQEFCWLQLR